MADMKALRITWSSMRLNIILPDSEVSKCYAVSTAMISFDEILRHFSEKNKSNCFNFTELRRRLPKRTV